ncbi:Flp pilus assembly protein TadD [Inhella inkyongensis]|uniref:Flp pilus assembly protein TadD n=1 Tax=Inhella inkyongensis TaxID=392593 RepID=A0A840S2B4_9BURK|nr:tetratricopeptide repeat protein [Inhella inkyongensis]MBB5203883.1 Flp pilus assembly protein TadD [Inhella inkyongensis]
MRTLLSATLLLTALWGSPARSQSTLDQAQTQWYSGRQAQAIELVEAAMAQNPLAARPRFTLAWMVQERGDLRRAETLLRALVQDFPDHAEGLNNLAVIQAQRGELDAALRGLQLAVQLQPEHAQAQENLGDVLLHLAQRAYGQAAKIQPAARLQLKTRQLEQILRPSAN